MHVSAISHRNGKLRHIFAHVAATKLDRPQRFAKLHTFYRRPEKPQRHGTRLLNRALRLYEKVNDWSGSAKTMKANSNGYHAPALPQLARQLIIHFLSMKFSWGLIKAKRLHFCWWIGNYSAVVMWIFMIYPSSNEEDKQQLFVDMKRDFHPSAGWRNNISCVHRTSALIS